MNLLNGEGEGSPRAAGAPLVDAAGVTALWNGVWPANLPVKPPPGLPGSLVARPLLLWGSRMVPGIGRRSRPLGGGEVGIAAKLRPALAATPGVGVVIVVRRGLPRGRGTTARSPGSRTDAAATRSVLSALPDRPPGV